MALGDRARAEKIAVELRSLALTDEDRAELADELRAAADLERWLSH